MVARLSGHALPERRLDAPPNEIIISYTPIALNASSRAYRDFLVARIFRLDR